MAKKSARKAPWATERTVFTPVSSKRLLGWGALPFLLFLGVWPVAPFYPLWALFDPLNQGADWGSQALSVWRSDFHAWGAVGKAYLLVSLVAVLVVVALRWRIRQGKNPGRVFYFLYFSAFFVFVYMVEKLLGEFLYLNLANRLAAIPQLPPMTQLRALFYFRAFLIVLGVLMLIVAFAVARSLTERLKVWWSIYERDCEQDLERPRAKVIEGVGDGKL